MYVNNMPSIDSLEEMYKEQKISKWRRRNESDLNKVYQEFKNQKSSKKDFFSKVLNNAQELTGKKSLKILEVGSAKGVFIYFANSQGHQAVGTEASKDVVTYVNSFHPGFLQYVHQNNFLESFEQEKFDLIYLEHVLEHLPNTNSIIGQFKQLLNPGGIIYLVVPNHGSYAAKKKKLNWANVTPPCSFVLLYR